MGSSAGQYLAGGLVAVLPVRVPFDLKLAKKSLPFGSGSRDRAFNYLRGRPHLCHILRCPVCLLRVHDQRDGRRSELMHHAQARAHTKRAGSGEERQHDRGEGCGGCDGSQLRGHLAARPRGRALPADDRGVEPQIHSTTRPTTRSQARSARGRRKGKGTRPQLISTTVLSVEHDRTPTGVELLACPLLSSLDAPALA